MGDAQMPTVLGGSCEFQARHGSQAADSHSERTQPWQARQPSNPSSSAVWIHGKQNTDALSPAPVDTPIPADELTEGLETPSARVALISATQLISAVDRLCIDDTDGMIKGTLDHVWLFLYDSAETSSSTLYPCIKERPNSVNEQDFRCIGLIWTATSKQQRWIASHASRTFRRKLILL